MPHISPIKPPYVQFEYRAVEDRTATVQAGGVKKYKDVAFALVTPAGGRDGVEKNAEEWLQQLKEKAFRDQTNGMLSQEEKYADQWFRHFSAQYEQFKAGNTPVENGTPIRICLMFTPAEMKAIEGANIRTLEDLATASEEAMARIGMGGRDLKDRAVRAMSASNDPGKLATKLEQAERDNEDLKARIERLEKALDRKKPGPKPRDEMQAAA